MNYGIPTLPMDRMYGARPPRANDTTAPRRQTEEATGDKRIDAPGMLAGFDVPVLIGLFVLTAVLIYAF